MELGVSTNEKLDVEVAEFVDELFAGLREENEFKRSLAST